MHSTHSHLFTSGHSLPWIIRVVIETLTASLLPILADRDFTFLIGSVRFFPGETVGAFECVSINIINDNIVEDDETFAVSLTSTGMLQAVGNTTANVTIFQDSDSKSDSAVMYSYNVIM